MPVQGGPVRRRRDLASALYDEGYELICKSFDEAPENILLNFWAGNFSIARSDALRVGVFDPAFNAPYHADRDFGLRCRSAGLEAIFDRSLRARHHHRRSWPQFNANSRSQGLSCLLVYARHADVLGPMALADFEPGGPRVRRTIRAARRPRLRPLAQAALSAGAAVACAARQPDLGLHAARLTRLIGFQQGAIEGTGKGLRTPVLLDPVAPVGPGTQPVSSRR
jgi:hypothetical protein